MELYVKKMFSFLSYIPVFLIRDKIIKNMFLVFVGVWVFGIVGQHAQFYIHVWAACILLISNLYVLQTVACIFGHDDMLNWLAGETLST